MDSTCPICRSKKFIARGTRPLARCQRCGALERGRLFWMLAERLQLFRPGAKVMHIAPERWLVLRTDVIQKCNYQAFDLDAEGLEFPVNVSKIDLCNERTNFPDDEFDVITHHHVLAHLPCALAPVLKEFRRILKPGGTMAFSIPVRKGQNTEEDLNPALSADERRERFGQHKHMRAFGKDTLAILTDALGEGLQADAGRIFTEEELKAAAVPPRAATTLTAHSTILYVKPAVSGNLEQHVSRAREVSSAGAQNIAKTEPQPHQDGLHALWQIREFLDDVATIVDVGVYKGTPALYEVFSDKSFILVDPMRDAESLILQPPKKYTFVNKALGSKPGRLTLGVQKAKSSLLERTKRTRREGPTEQYDVDVTTLDQVIEELCPARPLGMKIDTEGFELEVLAGLSKYTADFRFIVCEASVRRRFVNGYTFSDLILAMKSKGFEFFNILNQVQRRPNLYDVLFLPANHRLFK